MENFREMAANFLEAGASIRVNSAEELGSVWIELLRDPGRAARMGAAARELVNRNRGATHAFLRALKQIIIETMPRGRLREAFTADGFGCSGRSPSCIRRSRWRVPGVTGAESFACENCREL